MKAVSRSTGIVLYVLVQDRSLPETERSVFHLRTMTQGERMDAYDGMTRTVVLPSGEVEQKSRGWRQALEQCVARIERVDNFPTGAPQPWPEGEQARVEYLSQLDATHVNELGAAIREASTMSEAAGN